MKAIIIALLLMPTVAQAQPDPARSAGFRGFRLGMKADAVRALIDTTRFSYSPTGDSVWATEWFGSITVTPRKIGTDSAQKVVARMGCNPSDSTDCEEFESFDLFLFHGILYGINVESRWYNAKYAILGRAWCRVAQDVIALRYGKPQEQSAYLHDLSTEQYLYMPSGSYTFAAWSLSKARVGSKQSIDVKFYMSTGSADSRSFRCDIMIFDDGLSEKADAENRAQAAAEEARQEEERRRIRAKAKSDF